MHFLGGLWLGLAFLWLFLVQDFSKKLILKIILGVFIIGILWEVFEILVNNNIAQNSFSIFDTLSDICFNLAGGILAIVYYFKKIMFKQKIEV